MKKDKAVFASIEKVMGSTAASFSAAFSAMCLNIPNICEALKPYDAGSRNMLLVFICLGIFSCFGFYMYVAGLKK